MCDSVKKLPNLNFSSTASVDSSTGWNRKPIKDLLEAIIDYRGKTPPKSLFGIPTLTAANVKNGRIDLSSISYVSQETYDRWITRGLPKPGDVIITTEAPVGEVASFPDDQTYLITRRVMALRGKSNELDNNFLKYSLLYSGNRDRLLAVARGSTVPRVLKTDITGLEIAVPPLSEQKAIAHILGTIDDKIELNREMNQTLEAMARAIFKSWFVDFDPVRAKMEARLPAGMDAATAELFPSEFEESALGMIPNGWRIGRLDDLLVLQRGFDLPTSQRVPGKFPVIAASGASGTHAEYKVKGPGVATGRSGLLGKVFFVHEDFWPLNTSLWVKEFKNSRPIHAYHLLSKLEFETFNAGSAVPTLNRNHIHSLPEIIPPISIVEVFEDLVIPMFRKCRANEKQSATLASIRDTLLPKLLSGEIRVKEAEKVLEAVT